MKKENNKARLKAIHDRLAAFDSIISYNDDLLFNHAVHCLEEIKEEADYLIKSMEKLGKYDPKAEED